MNDQRREEGSGIYSTCSWCGKKLSYPMDTKLEKIPCSIRCFGASERNFLLFISLFFFVLGTLFLYLTPTSSSPSLAAIVYVLSFCFIVPLVLGFQARNIRYKYLKLEDSTRCAWCGTITRMHWGFERRGRSYCSRACKDAERVVPIKTAAMFLLVVVVFVIRLTLFLDIPIVRVTLSFVLLGGCLWLYNSVKGWRAKARKGRYVHSDLELKPDQEM